MRRMDVKFKASSCSDDIEMTVLHHLRLYLLWAHLSLPRYRVIAAFRSRETSFGLTS
jgi:hypothetical protein